MPALVVVNPAPETAGRKKIHAVAAWAVLVIATLLQDALFAKTEITLFAIVQDMR